MDDKTLENIVTKSIRLGTMETLTALGLLSDQITPAQARKIAKQRQLDEWRTKGWITGYPTGNPQRGKFYYKRSEIERAILMTSLGSLIPVNRIHKTIME